MPKGSGRRPLPTAVKRLRGNPGKRKLNDAEPAPAQGEPKMPAGLSAVAREEWRAIVPELKMLGVLSVIDGKALAGYCHAYARWIEAEQEVTRLGLLLKEPIFGPDGKLLAIRWKSNPAARISNEALKTMRAFLVEFGMTPSARTRVRMGTGQSGVPADSLESLLNRNPSTPTRVN